jgi:hypothetical protein
MADDPAGARNGVNFRRVRAARWAADDAVDRLRAAVCTARDAGDSWTIIGAALGTTPQKAKDLFESLT